MKRLTGSTLPALLSAALLSAALLSAALLAAAALAGPAAALPAVRAAALPAPAPAAASHRIGNCRASGMSARCLVKGTAVRPRTILVHLSASPSQRLLVRWQMTCRKGMSVRKSHGRIHARTPIRRRLHHPFHRPGSCIVTARTHLPGHGRIHLWLTSRR